MCKQGESSTEDEVHLPQTIKINCLLTCCYTRCAGLLVQWSLVGSLGIALILSKNCQSKKKLILKLLHMDLCILHLVAIPVKAFLPAFSGGSFSHSHPHPLYSFAGHMAKWADDVVIIL